MTTVIKNFIFHFLFLGHANVSTAKEVLRRFGVTEERLVGELDLGFKEQFDPFFPHDTPEHLQ